VLIVEDEPDLAELVADVLDLEGFEPHQSSGESALDDALTVHPDVVLLDLMMPGIDGFEVARRLHAHEKTQDLPIIVMTAMHDPATRAREVGTRHFLAKPFDIGELIKALQVAMT
jgi:DNA-binding response OmpR family regulator